MTSLAICKRLDFNAPFLLLRSLVTRLEYTMKYLQITLVRYPSQQYVEQYPQDRARRHHSAAWEPAWMAFTEVSLNRNLYSVSYAH